MEECWLMERKGPRRVLSVVEEIRTSEGICDRSVWLMVWKGLWKEGNGKAVSRYAGKARHRKLASLAKANQQPSETNDLLKN